MPPPRVSKEACIDVSLRPVLNMEVCVNLTLRPRFNSPLLRTGFTREKPLLLKSCAKVNIVVTLKNNRDRKEKIMLR